ncbi:MAG TPA: hypothetical protein VKP58_08115 [Candidatus Acidoferrum sp.]|nr:hypothetical protein [Candidatus Acidoferrum sp.]
MSEIWIEKCDNAKCGAEQRVESMVPTLLDPTWLYVILEKGGKVLCFCGKCAAPIREMLKNLLPAAAPEIPPPQGPVQ